MSSPRSYFNDLAAACSASWNRFWFTPRDARTVSLLRILAGGCALYFVASFSSDLVRWFGPSGMLDATTTSRLMNTDLAGTVFRPSYLYLATTPEALWALHLAGILILLAFTAGLFSRATNIASVVVTLSYVHRGPMISGRFELVLVMLLVYLCIGHTGTCWSIDRWLRRRRSRDDRGPTIGNNIATRLVQLHLAGLSITIGLNMLAGEVWWSGEAIWWLIARSESRLLDLTGLASSFMIVNLWTHATVAYMLGFGLLVWNRLARPAILSLGLLVWIPLAIVTGQVAWCAVMLVASMAFIEPETLARFARRQRD